MSEAGIEVPELRCPTTPTTLASTSFCATVVPTLGSAWSSSATSVNFTGWPPSCTFASFASSMARRAPFSLSLPKCAIWPVSGPTCPILISCAAGAGDALVASAAVFAAGFGCSPQAMSAAAAAISVAPTLLFMRSSRGLRGRAYDTARPGWHSRRALARYHLVTVVSLLRQDPLHQRAHVRVWHVRIGRHRHLPPGSLAALLHL